MNKFAQALGRMGKGKKKTLTPGQRKELRAHLARQNRIRWLTYRARKKLTKMSENHQKKDL